MHTAVKGYCLGQRSGKTFENRFDDVMRILAVKHADMQREACLHCQSAEKFLRHLGIVNAKLYLRNIRVKNKIRTLKSRHTCTSASSIGKKQLP